MTLEITIPVKCSTVKHIWFKLSPWLEHIAIGGLCICACSLFFSIIGAIIDFIIAVIFAKPSIENIVTNLFFIVGIVIGFISYLCIQNIIKIKCKQDNPTEQK